MLCSWSHIGVNVRIMEKNMETTMLYRGYIGMIKNSIETTTLDRGYIGIMAKNMETTLL